MLNKVLALPAALLLLLHSNPPKLNKHSWCHNFCRWGIQEWLKWVVLAQGLSWCSKKTTIQAAESWKLDCNRRTCSQAHCYGYWHISGDLLPSSLMLLQADLSSLPYGPLQRLSELLHNIIAGFSLLRAASWRGSWLHPERVWSGLNGDIQRDMSVSWAPKFVNMSLFCKKVFADIIK